MTRARVTHHRGARERGAARGGRTGRGSGARRGGGGGSGAGSSGPLSPERNSEEASLTSVCLEARRLSADASIGRSRPGGGAMATGGATGTGKLVGGKASTSETSQLSRNSAGSTSSTGGRSGGGGKAEGGGSSTCPREPASATFRFVSMYLRLHLRSPAICMAAALRQGNKRAKEQERPLL